MPVRIREKQRFQGSVTPSALNTETDIINLGDQYDDYIIEGQVDLRELTSTDTVVLRVYLAVDGTTQSKVDEMTLTGPVDPPVVRVLAHTVPYNAKFRVTATQTAGTLRTLYYSFIVEVMETI